jgi:hypothetical protein
MFAPQDDLGQLPEAAPNHNEPDGTWPDVDGSQAEAADSNGIYSSFHADWWVF